MTVATGKLLLVVLLASLVAVAGWKWGQHSPNGAPTHRSAGWTWDDSANPPASRVA